MATNGTLCGVFQTVGSGAAAALFAGAFTNPASLDILQVINEGGKVVWNLTSAGVATTNPTTWSVGSGNQPQSLLQQMFGSSLAAAIASAFNTSTPLDLLQIIDNNGQGVLLHVTNAGSVVTP